MSTFHIWTLGCQMNKADSLKLAAGLQRLGYAEVPDDRDADLMVINTCAVRQRAEDRAASRLGLLRKRREAGAQFKIAVMGCMVGPRTEELERRFPWVDAWARPQQFDPILEVRRRRARRPRRLRGRVLGGDARAPGRPDRLRAGGARLRQVLHLLYRSATAGPRALPPRGRGAGRGAPPGRARRARGHPARPDRRSLRPRPRRAGRRRRPGDAVRGHRAHRRHRAHPLPHLVPERHDRPHHRRRGRSAEGVRALQPAGAVRRRRRAGAHASRLHRRGVRGARRSCPPAHAGGRHRHGRDRGQPRRNGAGVPQHRGAAGTHRLRRDPRRRVLPAAPAPTPRVTSPTTCRAR